MPQVTKSPQVRDPDDLFQRETRDAIKRLSALPLLNGALLEGIDLKTTTVRVAHRLGRPARGFIVVNLTSNQRVWRDSTDAAQPHLYLPLIATAPVTVSLWVF